MIKLTDVSLKFSDEDLQLAFEGLTRLKGREDIGFFQLPERPKVWKQSMTRASDLKAKYDHLFVIGIGGSSLGAKVLLEACSSEEKVVFFENVDGKAFWNRLKSFDEKKQDWSRVHWVIISKSGNTMETLAQAQFADQFLSQKGLRIYDHCTVITEERSNPLYDWAEKYLVKVLEIPRDVGGRFSALTPVGLLPAAFAGINIEEIQKGAQWGLMQDRMIAELCALSLASFQNEKWITLFWSYSDQLREYGLWMQQLWAESLAKKVDRQGRTAPRVSSPMPLVGAIDQHSVLQQVCEGAKDKFIWFLRARSSEEAGPALKEPIFPAQAYMKGKKLGDLLRVEALATRQATHEAGVDSLTLVVKELNGESIGALMIISELTVATLGELLDINAFDQPGVELGKTLAKSKLIN